MRDMSKEYKVPEEEAKKAVPQWFVVGSGSDRLKITLDRNYSQTLWYVAEIECQHCKHSVTIDRDLLTYILSKKLLTASEWEKIDRVLEIKTESENGKRQSAIIPGAGEDKASSSLRSESESNS